MKEFKPKLKQARL